MASSTPSVSPAHPAAGRRRAGRCGSASWAGRWSGIWPPGRDGLRDGRRVGVIEAVYVDPRVPGRAAWVRPCSARRSEWFRARGLHRRGRLGAPRLRAPPRTSSKSRGSLPPAGDASPVGGTRCRSTGLLEGPHDGEHRRRRQLPPAGLGRHAQVLEQPPDRTFPTPGTASASLTTFTAAARGSAVGPTSAVTPVVPSESSATSCSRSRRIGRRPPPPRRPCSIGHAGPSSTGDACNSRPGLRSSWRCRSAPGNAQFSISSAPGGLAGIEGA